MHCNEVKKDAFLLRIPRGWALPALSVTAAVLACAPRTPKGTCRPGTPAQTRNRILSAAPEDVLTVFVSRKKLWVMGSAVARLEDGRPTSAEVSDGVHEPLLQALYQETRAKSARVARIVVYATSAVPRKTVDLVTKTAKAARLGRVFVLPWELVAAGSCKSTTRPLRRAGPARTIPEPRLSTSFPLVARANSKGVWINGQLVLQMEEEKTASRGAGTAQLQVLLQRRLSAAMKHIPPQRWRLLLVVTPQVPDSVVLTVLSAAGAAGIAKFKLERQLEE